MSAESCDADVEEKTLAQRILMAGDELLRGAPDEGSSALPDWVHSLFANLGIYFVMVLIAWAAIKVIKRKPPLRSDHSMYAGVVRFCVFGPEEEDIQSGSASSAAAGSGSQVELSFGMKALQLMFCVGGLLGAYLSWGLLQEKIITTDYASGRFSSSNFLVFCNRALALSVAVAVTSIWRPPQLKSPFYMFSFTSLSNVMSSWCQLESLKYVTFPTQVLAKSSKLIPVMLMGKVISKKKYKYWEYAVALTIGGGVTLFMIAQQDSDKKSKGAETTTLSGIFLLVGYLVFDSFTSQWQGHLFSTYKMTSYQMMVGINTFSATFTLVSLLQSGELLQSVGFVSTNLDCFFDILCFSIAGAVGQMFIFYTIKTFGPVVFTMIMTVRQLVAIVLSCIIYGHAISPGGLGGAVVVFSALGYNIYMKHQANEAKKKAKRDAQRKAEQRGAEDEHIELLSGVDEKVGLSGADGGQNGEKAQTNE